MGAIVPSIGRKEIEKFKIEMCSKEQQVALGQYWLKSIEKRVLETKKNRVRKTENFDNSK